VVLLVPLLAMKRANEQLTNEILTVWNILSRGIFNAVGSKSGGQVVDSIGFAPTVL
jgi:hypothetical protein